MGNFNRLGLPLLLFALFGCAFSSRVNPSLYKVSLGSVSLYDEDRTTMLELIVPVESSLFGTGNTYNEDAVTSLKELALTASSYCKDVNQDAGTHSKIEWSATKSAEPLSSEAVKQLKHKYVLALEELKDAKDLDVNELKNTILKEALRPVVHELPNPKGTVLSLVGCTSQKELVISLTSSAAIDGDVKIKMMEVSDYGRFVNDKKAFVRVDIARHWAYNPEKNAWYRVDFERCEKSHKVQTPSFICPQSALSYANECTPEDLNGCDVSVDFVTGDANFVSNHTMPNGSVVVASNMPQFNILESGSVDMPSSGVILADLTPEARLTFGSVKIRAKEGQAAMVFKWSPVNTEASMIFADMHVFETDFDASGWAFRLSTDSGSLITIVGRRTGALYVASAFIVDNVWWCLVVTVAIVLSVALTLLTLFCRGRISSAYHQYSPRLQRKRSPSASHSESSTSSTPQEDPEVGQTDEEFEAARKKKIGFSQFKISLFGDKTAKLTDRAPSLTSEDSTSLSRYYKNIRQMVMLNSLKAKKSLDEDTDSNTATDGSDSDKTSDVELTSVKVDEKPLLPAAVNNNSMGANVPIFQVADFLDSSAIPEEDLVDVRHNMLRTRRKPSGDVSGTPMIMNLVDFFALIKHGSGIKPEDYEKIMTQEGLPREDCSRLGYALKGLHLKNRLNAGRAYRFHHLVRKFPKTYILEDSQLGKTTMADLYKYNYGVELKYQGMPVVAVYPPGGHREFLPMEMLQVCEDQELIFASIRLARLAATAEKILKDAESKVKAELNQQQQAQPQPAKNIAIKTTATKTNKTAKSAVVAAKAQLAH